MAGNLCGHELLLQLCMDDDSRPRAAGGEGKSVPLRQFVLLVMLREYHRSTDV